MREIEVGEGERQSGILDQKPFLFLLHFGLASCRDFFTSSLVLKRYLNGQMGPSFNGEGFLLLSLWSGLRA